MRKDLAAGLLVTCSLLFSSTSTGFAAPAELMLPADIASIASVSTSPPDLKGECVYQCATDMECQSGQKCIDTGCGRVCETPCNECTSDRDCGALYECVNYRCGKKCAVACPDGASTTAAINELFTALTPTLNEQWPAFATKEGLDPMESVYSGDIDLECENGGNTICGFELGSCKKFYAHVKVTDLTGLSKLQFDSLAVTGLSTYEGSHSCEYGDEPYSGNFLCSYQGSGTGKASLPSDKSLGVSVPVIEIKTRCTTIAGTYTTVQWSGSATCHAKKPSGTAEFGWCGGSCTSRNPPEVLASAKMTKLKLAVKDLDCDIKGDWMGDASTLAWVGEILVPEMKNQIVNEIEGPLKRALNDLIEGVVPFPGECK